MLRARIATGALACLAMAGACAHPAWAAGAKRPNVVVVTTDDQALASLDQGTMPRAEKLIGNRGAHGTWWRVRDSVPNLVLRHAPCSVLVVDTRRAQ